MAASAIWILAIFCAAVGILHVTPQLNVSSGVFCITTAHTVTHSARDESFGVEILSPTYKPSSLEEFVVKHADKFSMNATHKDAISPMCSILIDSNTDLKTT